MLPTDKIKLIDFVDGERCRCCDNGWDGVSRSIHWPCHICKKPHVFGHEYTTLESLFPVWKKLGLKSITIPIDDTLESAIKMTLEMVSKK